MQYASVRRGRSRRPCCPRPGPTGRYAPYWPGTYRCLGSRRKDLQLAVNVLMIAHYFTLEVAPARYSDALPFSLLPSLKPTEKLKFHIAGQGVG